MPWHIAKVKGGYKVVTDDTGKAHSDKPMTRKAALAQLAALNIRKKKGLIQ